jgi:hypothetical protein
MKNKLARSYILQLCVVMLAFGFYSVAQAQIDNVNVQLRLNAAQTGLDVKTTGQCSNNNHNGCFEVGKGKTARINFTLVGDKKCNKAAGASWELGDVYLGGKGSSSKPSGWGGLDGLVQADFNVANASSGKLNKESDSNKNSIVISDNNASPGGYDIWYKVTAVCVDGSGNSAGTVETDPRIKNGGKR